VGVSALALAELGAPLAGAQTPPSAAPPSAESAPPAAPAPAAPAPRAPVPAPGGDAPAVAAPVVVPPRAISDTDVAYPAGAAGNASVELELLIRATGEVGGASVLSGEPPFAEAAQTAALGWRFEPALRNGVPVAARIRFRVGFEQVAEPEPLPAAPAPAAAGAPTSGDAPPAPAPPAPLRVTVTGERAPGARTVSRAFARELPGAFGNPFAAIEASPGVTPTLSGAPYFYVRGAPPGNLGYFIDDIRLPVLFHVLAGPSVLHPAMVESLDFFPGPYPARHGRFTGGIAAAHVRRPSYGLHGELSLRAFDSSGLIEIPLASTTSLTLAGRVAYANPIARLFAPEISVAYWDYQARLAFQLTPRDELAVLAFGSRDSLDRRDDDGEREVVFGTEFHRLQLRYERQLERGRLRVMAVGGADRSDQADGDVRLENTTARLRADLEQQLGPELRLGAGIDAGLDRYRLDASRLDDDDEREDYEESYPTRLDSVVGGYVGVRSEPWSGIRLDMGARADLFGSEEELELGVAPSLLAEFDISPSLTLVNALGVAHQPPSSDVPQPGSNPALGAGLQHALQSSAGLRLALPGALRLEATLYQAALFNLSDGIGISRIDNGDDDIDESSRAQGVARGLELLLERELGQRLGGYVAYTLGSSRRSVGRAEGPALFDRRHVLSGAFSYRFGSGFRGGLRGTFYTGVPADVAYLAAARNPPRTTPFYRLDVRLEKRWRLNDAGAFWAIVLEVLNTTLNEEALGKSCSAYVCREDSIGPVTIPSLGLDAMF
jgi:TonB family protein